jgi:hypothetical protein
MVYYYLKPNPAAFSQWIKDLSASGGFDKPSARAPIMVLKGAAKWSLSSNIQQHKRVKEIVKARQSKESGLLHKELQDVIENTSSKPRG